MSKTGRRLKLLVVAICAGLALAACGGSGGGSAADTLTVWWFEDPGTPQDTAWKQALKDLEAAHPGVDVKFEKKQWQQLNDSGAMILNSEDVPDVLEYPKGNASAGAVSSKGLLTDLTAEAAARGWDKEIGGAATVGLYDDRGLMGSGKLYGVPSYGEFVSFFYNKDMFAKYGLQVPTTMDELVSAFQTFESKGITPLGEAAADYPAQHLLWALAAGSADADWRSDYFGLAAPLDTSSSSPLHQAAQTMVDWTDAGYIDKRSTGLKADAAWDLFRSDKVPMVFTGTWMVGDFATNIKDFKWGQFLLPGAKAQVGSGGNIWAVPTNAKNKDLAYDFIDLTLETDHQNLMAKSGGVAVNADPAAITDPLGKFQNETFSQLVEDDALGLYGDWPVPNFYQVIQTNTQTLVGGSQSVDDFMGNLATAYDQVQANVG